MAQPSAETVSNAIVLWTGCGVTNYPQRDEARVVMQFGRDAALDLMPVVHALEHDFYLSTANQTVSGLVEMTDQAASEFRERHPEISDDAVAALAWCYSWDWK